MSLIKIWNALDIHEDRLKRFTLLKSVIDVFEGKKILSSHRHAWQEISFRPSQSLYLCAFKVSRFVVSCLLNNSFLVFLKSSADKLHSSFLISRTTTWGDAVDINWRSEGVFKVTTVVHSIDWDIHNTLTWRCNSGWSAKHMIWQDSLVTCKSIVLIPGAERHSFHPGWSHISLVANGKPASKVTVLSKSIVIIRLPVELGGN